MLCAVPGIKFQDCGVIVGNGCVAAFVATIGRGWLLFDSEVAIFSFSQLATLPTANVNRYISVGQLALAHSHERGAISEAARVVAWRSHPDHSLAHGRLVRIAFWFSFR